MNTETKKDSDFVIVPFERISDEALVGLIQEFILREGTDYGQEEYSLEEKYEQVKKQLISGKIKIVFDTTEESTSIIRNDKLY